MKSLSTYINLIIIISLLLSSCDPACDGVMKITNSTDDTLSIVILKNGDFKIDSIQFQYQINKYSQSIIAGDTLLILKCCLPKNQELELYYEGPLGTLDLKDKESALYYLNEISDSIYLENAIMKKDIKNMDNWEISVDKYNNGGGESLFEFILRNDDIEK
jgi:hypothetical protein